MSTATSEGDTDSRDSRGPREVTAISEAHLQSPPFSEPSDTTTTNDERKQLRKLQRQRRGQEQGGLSSECYDDELLVGEGNDEQSADATSACCTSATSVCLSAAAAAAAAAVSSSLSVNAIPKRNKRKMTEPKKRRIDFSIRSLCSNSDDDVEEEEEEEEKEEKEEDKDGEKGINRKKRRKNTDDQEGGGGEGGEEAEEENGQEVVTPLLPGTKSDACLTFSSSSSSISSSISPITCSSSSLVTADHTSSSFHPLSLHLVCHRRHCAADSSILPRLHPPLPFRSTDYSNTTTSAISNSNCLASSMTDCRRPSTSPLRLASADCTSPTPGLDNPLSAAAAEDRYRREEEAEEEEEEEEEGEEDAAVAPLLSRRPRKNYKNMTRQRRIEANARERTRVHTISAAFESLRRAVPSYSYNQRLSKLAILRIACSYILALARLAELDYSQEQAGLTFSDCVDLCTQTIQAEGKAKRRH